MNLTKKLAIIIGFISMLVAGVSSFAIIQIVFFSTERQIKNDLADKHAQIVKIAIPDKSQELANYLRENDLSLFIFDDQGNTIARYGIYRNLDKQTLTNLMSLERGEPSYIDRQIKDYGEYDIYTSDNIQVSVRNNVFHILKNSFYLSLIIMLPLVWIASIITAIFVTKIIVSPLLRAKNISHELKTPLARAVSSLQVLIDEIPKSKKHLFKLITDDLIHLGGNVDSLLSLSLFKKNEDMENSVTDIKKEINKLIKLIPKSIKIKTKLENNLIIPVASSYINIIIRNLIENAAKYNKPKGYIYIKTVKYAGNWVMEIKNPTEKVKAKGYGLGITIIKDICHNQNLLLNISKTRGVFRATISGRLK